MVHIENLSFSYSKKEKLYEDLNLDLKKGSIVGLLGKNGAGKSTLLRLMGGLLNPESGNLKIMNHEPAKRKPAFLQDVFFVPEELSIPGITIKNYIKALSPLYPNFDNGKMENLLSEFELSATQNLKQMSYGQKKKFIIAFALATNCQLLIMDEPTNGLDIPSKSLFRKVLAGALSDEQLVIISTHQVKDVENLIDRIILIDNGKFIFNNDLINISDNYSFCTISELNGDQYLYKEVAPGGYKVIKPYNANNTPIDIELLFNAITNGTKLDCHESNI